MVYKFKRGSYIKADPQVAGEMLERLEAENNLTAKSLVDANRDEDAPLHNEFEWDDSVAAEAYRETQARHIINCIEIVREEAEPVRAFFSIYREKPQYQHIDTILVEKESRDALLQKALAELNAIRRKYSTLKELANVFSAIDEAEKKVG